VTIRTSTSSPLLSSESSNENDELDGLHRPALEDPAAIDDEFSSLPEQSAALNSRHAGQSLCTTHTRVSESAVQRNPECPADPQRHARFSAIPSVLQTRNGMHEAIRLHDRRTGEEGDLRRPTQVTDAHVYGILSTHRLSVRFLYLK